jgi:signal transduction histidine kinase
MSSQADPRSSTRAINRRLILLLIRAYAAVVLLIAALLVIFAVIFFNHITSSDPLYRSPITFMLETYYMVNGGWGRVDTLVNSGISSAPEDIRREWTRVILLDQEGYILVDHGSAATGRIGSIYQDMAGDQLIELTQNGQVIGSLVVNDFLLPSPWGFMLAVFRPLVFTSILLAILTLAIGLLLTRRVAAPLADVIAAAQAVTAGNLSARVKVQGPDDFRALSDSFNRMASSLEHNDRERRNMLADITHELRTPLTVIRGRLEGIADGIYPLDDAHLVPLLEETQLLERLIEDLRVLALAEARQLHFDYRPVNLDELAQHVASLFEAEAGEVGIRIKIQAEPSLPPVMGDPQRLEQVIGNLVSNALRYAPENSQVCILIRAGDDGVELAVNDEGPGVPEEDLAHLFDRFWRGEKSRTRTSGGAGLGLAIALQLIEAQKGKIWAQNLSGGGLQVGFVLPSQTE